MGYPDYEVPPEVFWEYIWIVSAVFFNAVFALELTIRMAAAQHYFIFSPWLWFDMILVTVGVIDTLTSLGVVSLDVLLNPSMARLVRLARILRLAKLLKARNALNSLFLLLKSVRAAVSASVWSVILMFLIVTAASMVMNQLLFPRINDETVSYEVRHDLFLYFGTYTKCLITMFEITMMNWGPPCRMLMGHAGDGWGLLIVSYRCVFCFAVFSVIAAVFIAETNRVAAADDEVAMMNKERMAKLTARRVKDLFMALDDQGDGTITWEEFQPLMGDPTIRTFLKTLELEHEDCELVFNILDVDGEGHITCDEFLHGMSAIRGSARRIDIATVLKVTRKIDARLSLIMPRRT